MSVMTVTPFAEPLSERLTRQAPRGVVLYWLGQAGFILGAHGQRILIDPYLSDSLAEKYRGRTFSHERLMPPPVSVTDAGRIDLVLITHHHTDHMDPATLGPIAENNPHCRFVAPRASLAEAVARIAVSGERIIAMDAGETVEPFPGCTVTAIRAAHETLERTPDGLHRFLGYVIDLDGVRIYHSGDTIPFDGLQPEVAALHPLLALLPVNGRRPELTEAGIAGNLTFDEACALANGIGARAMIAHHYGMFAFNTADPATLDEKAARRDCAARIHRARTSVEYGLAI
jgi:L-ascorbate metabolism protein UlaG (beta-lactamase superfamily)